MTQVSEPMARQHPKTPPISGAAYVRCNGADCNFFGRDATTAEQSARTPPEHQHSTVRPSPLSACGGINGKAASRRRTNGPASPWVDSFRQPVKIIVVDQQNVRILGSVAQGTDVEGSDLDILVDPTPDTTLFDSAAIRHELLQRLGIPVDVLTPNALPDEFRAAVLAGAIPL